MKTFFRIIIALLFSSNFLLAQNDTSLIPLTELYTNTYKSFTGGLYPEGSNQIPTSHLQAGMNISENIVPLNSAGDKDTLNGKIVLLSIGMSNTTQEFSTFKPIADTLTDKNPYLIIVDGAQGGQTAAIIQDPAANFWTVVNQRLSNAKVTQNQVQVIWLKEADIGPKNNFPIHAQTLSLEMKKICQIFKVKFPNVKICYLSSRIYGGYATTSLNPEPMAYESGFSVKWLIEAQIKGDTALAYEGLNPKSPWLAWGPYLWANGMMPRADGLIWEIDDFVTSDRTHPSPSGRLKVANMLLNFFQNDETAKQWFLKKSITDVIENPPNDIFSIYPNPALDYINIQLSESFKLSERYNFIIYNILGVEQTPSSVHVNNNTLKINISHLPQGTYTAIIYYNSKIISQNFIVIK